jgi:hypothetical protein
VAETLRGRTDTLVQLSRPRGSQTLDPPDPRPRRHHVTFARTRPWAEAVASSLTEAERLAASGRFYPWIDQAYAQ